MKRIQNFQTIRSEGGLLPLDLLRRVLDSKGKLEGTAPEDYGLPQSERLNEMITQSWNRLRKHWTEFRAAAANLPEGEPGTGLTNDKWSLPLLRELSFGPLPTTSGPEINGRFYAISRFVGAVPVHLVGCGVSLDRRAAGVRGAAAINPHGLVQEFLNRSSGHLWAIVSNGLCLRILRDNQALSRQSFLEFDLETMFDGELYSDFVLLWLMAHATRFTPREGERPETCWLEQWTRIAQEQGTRALGELRGGVEKALQILGEGFTSHSKNTFLRDALRTGLLAPSDFHGQLLRVIYRLIFLFVAEDRILDGLPLLHPRDESDVARLARERYAAHYGTARLRELASKIKGSRHGDLWCQFQLLVNALSGDAAFTNVREHLALPALGSFLWNPANTARLNGAELTNHDFLESLRNLAFTRQGKILRPVDYRNLGAEELGGVYESLLALSPQVSADGAHFTFAEFAGSERKTSGSYYTPDSLVQCLLDSALDPVVEAAIKGKTGHQAENAILALKVCDPAVGSGHFLVGAAHRLAHYLSRVRAHAQGESEPSPLLYQHALRDVIGHCLYGVDINPMAAELCRVSLWLEALEPGKPLSFLDHHIRVGNSLLGTTPELLAKGIPDEAFTPIEGDDKKFAAALKKWNQTEHNQMSLPLAAEGESSYGSIADRITYLDSLDDDSIDRVHEKEETYERLNTSEEYRHEKLIADAWCAAFVWKKRKDMPPAVTEDVLRRLRLKTSSIPALTVTEIHNLTHQYQFFHWHLAFPEVLAKGGFDCMLGNPPWDKIQPEEQKFFPTLRPDIANAPSAKLRKTLIENLPNDDPSIHRAWEKYKRQLDGACHFLRLSGTLQFTGEGNLNSYRIFTELAVKYSGQSGWMGFIAQSGLATDESGKELFDYLLSSGRLKRFLDFENREAFFPDVDSRMRFCLITIQGSDHAFAKSSAEFGWLLHNLDELNMPNRLIALSADDLKLFNPSSRTCPIFTSMRDFAVSRQIYLHGDYVLLDDSRCFGNIDFLGELFNMTRDSALFLKEPDGNSLPLYEAKFIHQFDHRYATTTESGVSELDEARKQNPSQFIAPKSFVEAGVVFERAAKRNIGRKWMLGFRSIARATDERTVISAVFPFSAVGNSINLILGLSAEQALFLLANANCFIFDFCARQKISGSNVNIWIFKQLPVIPVKTYFQESPWLGGEGNYREWIKHRALELTYTAWDLTPFAGECGWAIPPFRWDDLRRFFIYCELNSAFFHLYLPADKNNNWCPMEGATEEALISLRTSFSTPREAVSYIMDTFPIVRRKDEEKYNGDYRTKRVILEIYDAMQESIRTSKPYQTRLDPPPADPRCCHPPKEHL